MRRTIGIAVILGILFGLAEATLWTLGFFSAIAIVPYATADALLIFGITAIIALFYRREDDLSRRQNDQSLEKCSSFVQFIKVIMISTAVFLIFIQILVGAVLPLALRIILAFIGSISFWVMFVTFIALVIWIARRH